MAGSERTCPGCGSAATRKDGRDRQGRQIAPCRGCRRRFTALTGTPFSGYRFPPDVIALAVRWYLRLPPELRRRGRAAGRARRARRPVDGLRLGAGVRPALRGRRAPLPPRGREQLERRRDLHQGRGQAGLRLPGHRRARPGRRRLREHAARDRGCGGLLPPRHRGHRRHPGRGDDRLRRRLSPGAGSRPPARRARDGEGGPAAHRARPPAPQGPAAPDARLQDAGRGAGALRGGTPSSGTCAAASTTSGTWSTPWRSRRSRRSCGRGPP